MTYPNEHDPFSRKSQIDRLRASQHSNEDNDWFFDKFDKTLNSGAKGFAKLAGIALILNLLFWGTLIVLAAWALGHFVF